MGWGEPHTPAAPLVFSEQSLRAAVVTVWGPAGAHVDVLDRVIGLAHDAVALQEDLVEFAAVVAQLGAELDAQKRQTVALANALAAERERCRVAEGNLASCAGRSLPGGTGTVPAGGDWETEAAG